MCVPHPARRNRSEPSTSPCRSSGATAPRLPRPTAGRAPGVPLLCAASGASASLAHPGAARASRPYICRPRPEAICAPGPALRLVCAASGASRPQRAEHVPVPIAHHDPPSDGHGQRRDVRLARHLCVPHPARRDRIEPSTSLCQSRVANPRPPATAGRGTCAGRATCVCRIRRVATAASRARPRAACATRLLPAFQDLRRDMRGACHMCMPLPARRDRSEPSTSPCQSRGATDPRLPWLAAGCALGVPLVCAAASASRSQRAEHVPVPLARRDSSTGGDGQLRNVRQARHVCAAPGASRSQRA
jgi:hypothetical protein